jgi:hypothetical protein
MIFIIIILTNKNEKGKNMRGEGFSVFLCGVRDDTFSHEHEKKIKNLNSNNNNNTNDNSNEIIKYRTVCKVGTGYSFDELKQLREKISNSTTYPTTIATTTNKQNNNNYINTNKMIQNFPSFLIPWNNVKKDDIPSIFIKPEDSFIVQLKCAELVDSNVFTANMTCRFPRLQKIRYDKKIEEAMTFSELIALKNKPRNLVNEATVVDNDNNDENNDDENDDDEHGKKTRKIKRKRKTEAENNTTEKTKMKRVNIIDDQFLIKKKFVEQDGKIFEENLNLKCNDKNNSLIAYCVIGEEFKIKKNSEFDKNLTSQFLLNSTSSQLFSQQQSFCNNDNERIENFKDVSYTREQV